MGWQQSRATFSLFARKLPVHRGFLIAAGLEDCLAFLEAFGDVWAVPEGTAVFADEPLLEVTAPAAEAQLVETALLNHVTFQTSVATKAGRRYGLTAAGTMAH